MDKANLAIVLALVAIILGGSSYIFIKPVQTAMNNAVGAQSGPDDLNPYHSNNGLTQWYFFSRMANASTTCSFKSPNATTTLVRAGMQFNNTFGGTFDATIGLATNAFSTTTSLGNEEAAIVAGSQDTMNASTTQGSASKAYIIAPNTFLNFKVGSATPTLQGTCGAYLIQS